MASQTLELILTARDDAWSPALKRAGTQVEQVGRRTERALNVLETAGRSAGSGFEDLGGTIQSVGILLTAIPHPVAKIVGVLATLGPQAVSTFGAFSEGAKKAEEALTRQARAVQEFASIASQAALDRAAAEADAAGRTGEVLALQQQKALSLLEQERTRRLDLLAQQNLDAASASKARFDIEKASVDERLALEADFQKRRQDLIRETEAAITNAATAASAARAQAAAEAQGPLAALEATRQARMQEIAAERQAAAEKLKILEGLGVRAGEVAELRRAAEQTALDKTVTAEIETAAKRKQIIEQSTTEALAIFQGLGARFADIAAKFGAAQFIQNRQNDLKALQAFKDALLAGDDTLTRLGITTKDVDDGMAALGEQIKDTLRSGVVPMKEAVEALATSQVHATDAGEAWLKSMEGLSATMDEIIRKTREAKSAQDALAGSPSGGGRGGGSTAGGGSGSVASELSGIDAAISASATRWADSAARWDAANKAANKSFDDFISRNTGSSVPSFDTGGVVPGPPGRPMLAWVHGGEEVVAREATAAYAGRGGDRDRGRAMVNHVTVNLSGTIIDQQRAWSTLVETLGQALDSRAMRRR